MPTIDEDCPPIDRDPIGEPISFCNARDEFESKLSRCPVGREISPVDPSQAAVEDFDSIGRAKAFCEGSGRRIEPFKLLCDLLADRDDSLPFGPGVDARQRQLWERSVGRLLDPQLRPFEDECAEFEPADEQRENIDPGEYTTCSKGRFALRIAAPVGLQTSSLEAKPVGNAQLDLGDLHGTRKESAQLGLDLLVQQALA